MDDSTIRRAGIPVDAEALGTSLPKARRGFALLDPQRRRQVSALGGKASHAKGTGHEWSTEAAREAGRKGGQASQKRRSAKPAAIPETVVPADADAEPQSPTVPERGSS